MTRHICPYIPAEQAPGSRLLPSASSPHLLSTLVLKNYTLCLEDWDGSAIPLKIPAGFVSLYVCARNCQTDAKIYIEMQIDAVEHTRKKMSTPEFKS